MIKDLLGMIKSVGLGVICTLFILQFIGGTAIVSGESMEKTLKDSDVLWVEKITQTIGKLKRGDIVTLYTPKTEYDIMVKRVIAVENDHVLIENGKVFVNGAELYEPYIKGSFTTPPEEENNDITISRGYVYVLGDNRSIGIYDSRIIGPINLDDIKGRVLFRFYPFNKFGPLIKN